MLPPSLRPPPSTLPSSHCSPPTAHLPAPQLAEGGTLFFRESCFRQSGDKARGDNPTHYRNPRQYFAIFDAVQRQMVGADAGRTAPGALHACGRSV